MLERRRMIPLFFLVTVCIPMLFYLYSTDSLSPVSWRTDTWWLKANMLYNDDCGQAKLKFWNTIMVAGWTSQDMNCILRDDNQEGIFSYFHHQNFENITCPKREIRFAETEMPMVALTSIGGSGNTWLRHVIECISGIATGSIYCGQLKKVFIGECHRNYTIVIKTHKTPAGYAGTIPYDKVVAILRNPYDSIMAQFNRIQTSRNKTGVAEKTMFETEEWDVHVRNQAERWRSHILNWFELYDKPLHIVSYGNMIHSFFNETFELAGFLGVNITFRDLWCASINQEGKFHRKKPEWMTRKNLFPDEKRILIQEKTDNVSRTLMKAGLARKALYLGFEDA